MTAPAGRAGRAAWLASLSLAALVWGGCAADPPAPTVASADSLGLPAPFGARLDRGDLSAYILDREGDAYALVEVPSDTGNVLVQYVDRRGAVVAQILGPATDRTPGPGLYHPTAPSPFVEMMPLADVVRQQAADPRLLAVLNGAFFETPGEPATQIAFPVAEAGTVVTGGSSPYGPGRPGADDERWGRPLRALGLGSPPGPDTTVSVVPYDPATGAPLADDGPFAEALVSYAPGSHPTRIATRFHVLGALDADGDGRSEVLLIATSDGRTTIQAPVRVLERLGVEPQDMIAIDGGASVFVWNRRAGTLHQPTPAGGRGPQDLPHLLTVRLR